MCDWLNPKTLLLLFSIHNVTHCHCQCCCCRHKRRWAVKATVCAQAFWHLLDSDVVVACPAAMHMLLCMQSCVLACIKCRTACMLVLAQLCIHSMQSAVGQSMLQGTPRAVWVLLHACTAATSTCCVGLRMVRAATQSCYCHFKLIFWHTHVHCTSLPITRPSLSHLLCICCIPAGLTAFADALPCLEVHKADGVEWLILPPDIAWLGQDGQDQPVMVRSCYIDLWAAILGRAGNRPFGVCITGTPGGQYSSVY